MLKPTIGILGGMGPKSTGPFVNQVIDQFQLITGASNDIDFPPIMIYSLPTPFFIDQPIDHKLMEKTICEGLKRLESCNVDFIAMPCNTAHVYFESLEKCIQIPLLNMVDLTLDAIPSSTKKIAILATRSTINSNIFQEKLAQIGLKNLSCSTWQETIDELILNIKAGNELPLKLWQTLSADLLAKHVDTILLACTDLNILFKNINTPFHIIDSSLCLAQSTVNQWQKTT